MNEAGAQDKVKPPPAAAMPKRVLGRTGVEVSILTFGTLRNPGLDRMLRMAWASGVTYIDTAKSYGSEPAVGKWMNDNPGIRKQLFVVTKDHPHTPKEMIEKLDERLKNIKTDYVDLIFIHGLGDRQHRHRDRLAQEQGIQGDRRGHPQVGQGEVRRLLVPPRPPGRDSSERGGRRIRRRDHGAQQPLAR